MFLSLLYVSPPSCNIIFLPLSHNGSPLVVLVQHKQMYQHQWCERILQIKVFVKEKAPLRCTVARKQTSFRCSITTVS